ncbi:Putative uncharacterized transposon-derived protein F52C9.6 [Eumeta japonica]|uniref:Uncharacterized transposon-derived protein F52C9.6 n=1 Tax=Eumeta variegata TaxID=151549 RepID=A0A4C2A032_EUMVA|nr:Putative uncharacterized transposon-derived protein F52C9.6 [Eumeta japonica]
MIEDLVVESERVGLKLNPEKTRVMTNGNKSAIEVGNTEINYIDEYVHLGHLTTLKEPMREEVKRRITNGWRSYWSLKEPMKDKKLHINIKRKLFNTCILPVLTYSCQSWTLTKEITNKLATCQYAMERNITLKIRKFKWRWAGHTIRGHDKWNQKVTRRYPREGKGKRGRPQKRWDDDIREVADATDTQRHSFRVLKFSQEIDVGIGVTNTDGYGVRSPNLHPPVVMLLAKSRLLSRHHTTNTEQGRT